MCQLCEQGFRDLTILLKSRGWTKEGNVWKRNPPLPPIKIVKWPWYMKVYQFFKSLLPTWMSKRIPYTNDLYETLPWRKR